MRANDVKQGMAVTFEGRLYAVIKSSHVKPGKGPPFVKVKLKNLVTGQVLDHTWRGEQKVELAILLTRKHQYLYRQGSEYHFMDMETYEMTPLSADIVGEDQLPYLEENMACEGLTRDGAVLAVELPQFVELAVVETEPGVRGDTAQGATKPARLGPGAVVQVPLFVNEGDVIKVDRNTDKYLERVTR